MPEETFIFLFWSISVFCMRSPGKQFSFPKFSQITYKLLTLKYQLKATNVEKHIKFDLFFTALTRCST
jgi:hypothetical protein